MGQWVPSSESGYLTNPSLTGKEAQGIDASVFTSTQENRATELLGGGSARSRLKLRGKWECPNLDEAPLPVVG